MGLGLRPWYLLRAQKARVSGKRAGYIHVGSIRASKGLGTFLKLKGVRLCAERIFSDYIGVYRAIYCRVSCGSF